MKKFLLLCLMFSTRLAWADISPTDAAPGACLDSAQVQSVLKAYEILHWDDDKNDWVGNSKIDNCDAASLVHKTVRSILFLQQLPRFAVAPGGVNSQVTIEGPANFFQKRISKIYIESAKHSGDAGACGGQGVIAFVKSSQPEMYICPAFGSPFFTDLMSSAVLVHEARHTEGYEHDLCLHGPYAKNDLPYGACDSSFEAQGSYGIGAGYVLNVYQGTKNEALRQEARANIVDDLITRFNKFPLEIQPGALLQKENGVVSFYDGKNHVLSQLKNLKVMAIRDIFPVYFGNDGSVKTYSFSKTLKDSLGAFAKWYREKTTPAQHNSLLDVYYGSISCLLFEKSLHCGIGDPNAKDVDIALNDIRPLRLFSDETGTVLSILDEDGVLHALPLNYSELIDATESDFQIISEPMEIMSRSDLDKNAAIAVKLDGSLVYTPDAVNKPWSPLKEFKGQKFLKVMPFLWSQKLENL